MYTLHINVLFLYMSPFTVFGIGNGGGMNNKRRLFSL